ncbi:DUF6221 family protein [Prauserella endophytica]|uniref:Uncharacterized protein n=1 Tax=Prauserella endophytica TaxID=1592324 RepID=A0ABY2S9N8_9PSEU|nr:DUF6221 family protein [Prauserella endophytica]PXY28931.1 hypothetical protein BAY59_14830 [Prauserella coralliicola]TKG72613.1 hypothetical protein FCN18_05045 [Prauserella endophytica]
MTELTSFVLARLDDDERRYGNGVLPALDEAERRGRLRIVRSDDGEGLVLLPGPVQAAEERVPVPFPEKAAHLRREIREHADADTARLIASVYAAHPDWREEWEAASPGG